MHIRMSRWLLPCLLLCHLCGKAQNIALEFRVIPSEKSNFNGAISDFKVRAPRPAEQGAVFVLSPPVTLDSLCRALIAHLRERSYLASSIDSLQPDGTDHWVGQLHLGPPMRWVRVRPANEISAFWLFNSGYRNYPLENMPMRYDALLAMEKTVLQTAENNGYPFATVRLDSLIISPEGEASALLLVDPKRYISLKGLKINGDIQLPGYFLPNYLGLKPGSPYSRDRVLRLKDQLNSLLFIESTANPTVTFAGNEATVNLFLQKKKASRFDFIIGILPQPQDAGQVLLTGSLSAAFQNALSLGERFSIELDRLRPETQKLDVQGSVPYLFGTVFGADGKLNIFKRDSTWVDTHGELGAQYLLSKGNYFRFFWENRSAALLKLDTASIVATKRLPANLDLSQNGFGLESAFSQLDYRFNPRKGWLVNLKGSAGFNQVLRNSVIEGLTDPKNPEYRFSVLYDSLSRRSSRFRLETRAECYIPVFTRSTVKLSFRGGGIFSSDPVFANEQYRVGGNKLLRGFNEESLQATRFAVATAEWRLLIGRNSFMGVFTDWGYIENITSRNRIFLRPAGIGAGLNFETPTGIFGINVAAGRPDTGEAFDFRALKFHLGYVSLI